MRVSGKNSWTRRPVRRSSGDNGGQDGFVLTWMGIMMVVLVAFAGIAVDVGNWYFVASREQKAADAAALSGAVFLPTDLSTGQSTATATAADNGFSSAQGDTVTPVAGDRPNDMRVTIKRTVQNFFLGLLGIGTTTITRQAEAEFQGPVPMGSPNNGLGTDPETGQFPDYWINVGAPKTDKTNGDRFAAQYCPSTTYGCTNGSTNSDYTTDGYSFAIHVTSTAAEAGRPLVFQAWDPEFAYNGDHCGIDPTTGAANGSPVWPTAAQLTALSSITPPGAPAGYYSDASTRYALGDRGAQGAHYCTGDTNNAWNGGSGQGEITTFIVRQPDTTPLNDFDNPVISTGTCQPMQTPAYDLGAGSPAGPTLYQLLNPTDGVADAQAVYNSANNYASGGLTFAESYHRWVTTCSIPSTSVTTGDYIVQIRSNAALGAPLVYDPTVQTGGYNRMALRTGWLNNSGTLDGTGVALYGNGKLPIYANGSSAASTFYLARVVPSGAARILKVPLFDMGDADVSGTLELLGPNGSDWSNCTFDRSFASTVTSGNCTLSGVSGGSGYNGSLVTINAPIPASYNCQGQDTSQATSCWFKIKASFNGGVQDTTTWQALIQGDPVRLVQ